MAEEPQHLEALALANRIRIGRALLRRQVLAGEVRLQAVLTDVPEVAASARVEDVLTWQTRWGRARSRKLLTRAGIPYGGRTLESLTERQRAAVAELLP